MTTETPDPVAAELARIRERRERARPQSGLPAHPPQARVLGEDEDDFPRLLAALDAARKLVTEWSAHAAGLDARADSAVTGRAVLMLVLARAQAYQDCAQALGEAVSRELLGEESGADNGDVCGVRAPAGPLYLCTEPLDHKGDHFDQHASGLHRHTWPQGEAITRELPGKEGGHGH